MGSVARKNTNDFASPFETAPRKLFYRPHVRLVYLTLMGAAATVELLTIATAIYLMISGKPSGGIALLLAGSFFPSVLALEAWYLMRPMAYSFVQLFPQHLHLSRIKKVFNIPYAEITKIEFSYLPYAGGWFVLHSNGNKPLRFTVVMERSELILDTIAAHRPELFPEDSLFKYRRTAIYCDHSWARIYEKARAWPALLGKYLFFPIVAALIGSALIQATQALEIFKLSIRFLFANFVVGYGFYLLEEFLIGKALRSTLMQSPSALQRNPALELKVRQRIQLFYFGISLAMFLYLAFYARWLYH